MPIQIFRRRRLKLHHRAFEPEISARKVHRSSGSEAPADDLQRLVEPIHRIGIGQPQFYISISAQHPGMSSGCT
jgi:hypothetical protein